MERILRRGQMDWRRGTGTGRTGLDGWMDGWIDAMQWRGRDLTFTLQGASRQDEQTNTRTPGTTKTEHPKMTKTTNSVLSLWLRAGQKKSPQLYASCRPFRSPTRLPLAPQDRLFSCLDLLLRLESVEEEVVSLPPVHGLRSLACLVVCRPAHA